MNKKKIVHICQAPVGGTVEYLRLFLENISSEEYSNILICPSYGNMRNTLENKVDRLYTIEMQREISFKKDLSDILEIRKVLKNENPDVVYLHSSKAGALGRLAAIGLKSKVIYNSHGWAFTIDCSEKKKKIYALIERLLYPLTDTIVNISKDEYNQALNYKIPKNKMVIIENGIDIEKFKDNEKVKFLDRYVLGFVGRLSEQKNPLYLIELAKELKDEVPNCLFYVVGDGELRSKLEKQIEENSLQNYFYLRGWSQKPEEDIRNFDVALMISKWEGFGLVVCEYMAAKKPVVAFPVGGVKNIIENDVDGVLNFEKLKLNINKIKNNENFKNYLVLNAYDKVKSKYSINQLIVKHKKIF